MQKVQQFCLVDFILEFSTYISSSLHEPTILISDALKLEADNIVLFETLFCEDSLLCELCSEGTYSDSLSLHSFSLSNKKN